MNRILGTVGRLTTLTMAMLFTISLVAQQPAPAPTPAPTVFKQIDVATIFDANTEAVLADKRLQSNIRRNVSFAKAQVYDVLRGGSALSDNFVIAIGTPDENTITNEQLLRGWYQNYHFALMTQASSMGDIDLQRLEFIKELTMICTDNNIHSHIVDQIAIPQMTAFLQENYHPAVKYNAMLIIGQLNSQVVITNEGRSVPVPLPAALTFMVNAIKSGTETDAVLLASWIGVLRHVRLNRLNQQIAGSDVVTIAGEAMKLLNQATPPANRSVGGQVWLQRRAIDVLAMIGQDDQKILPKIISIMQDEKSAMSLRLTAARALKYFNYSPSTQVPVESTSNALGTLIVRICRNEIDRVDQEKTLAALQEASGVNDDEGDMGGMGGAMGGMGGAMGGMGDGDMGSMGGAMGGMGGAMGGMGGAMGGSTDVKSMLKPKEKRQVDYTRRILVYQLFHVYEAIGEKQLRPNSPPSIGMYAAVVQDATGQEALDRIDEAMKALIETLSIPEPDDAGKPVAEPNRDALLESIATEIRKLESFVPPVETTPETVTADAPAAGVPGALPGS
ncbi:MAG: hypothetical protein HOB73_06950 [Planctomycetaceae bacterium]|nr:hypothetical protein [Planctomycetaceae bacterium]